MSERRPRRVLLAVVILLVLLAMSLAGVQASWWAIRGPVDDSTSLAPAYRITLVWLLACVGPAVVIVSARYPRSAPLFSRRRALPWMPWLIAGVIVCLGFCYWLGMIGAGVSGLTLAFAVVLSCASILGPVALIGLAFRRKVWTLVLPAAALLAAVMLYTAHYEQFFGR